jgi:hypothetical protein
MSIVISTPSQLMRLLANGSVVFYDAVFNVNRWVVCTSHLLAAWRMTYRGALCCCPSLASTVDEGCVYNKAS